MFKVSSIINAACKLLSMAEFKQLQKSLTTLISIILAIN
jgi:hypothetical protein